MKRSTSRAPDAPSPSGLRPPLDTLVVFVVAFAVLAVLRRRAFGAPYFWDEVGYYIPNAISMFRNHLDPIPDLTVPQSYPPLFPLALVAGWWAFGCSIVVTRLVGFTLAALVGATVYAIGRDVFHRSVGVAAATVTLLSPVVFGQAGLAHPEMLLALATTAATLALVRGKYGWHAVAVAALLTTKWTSIVALPAFGAYAYLTAPSPREGLRRQLAYLPGLLLLGAWLAYFARATGSLTSPDAKYLRVNLFDNLAAATLAHRFVVRFEQLLTYDAAWLLVVPAAIVGVRWLRRDRVDVGARTRDAVSLMLGLVTSTLAFLTVSGFLLPRYFVPVQPFVALLGTAAIFRLAVQPVVAAVAVAAIALVAHAGWYGIVDRPHLLDGSAEYLEYVEAHAQAARWLESNARDARIGAVWPVLDELREPFDGYVSRPLDVVNVAAFAPGTMTAADFDFLVESPAPGTPNTGGEEAARLGLVEVERFRVGRHVTVLWRPSPAPPVPSRIAEAPPR